MEKNSETTNSLWVIMNSFTFAKCDQHFWTYNIMWDGSFQMYWWTIYTRINQGLLLKMQVNWFSPGTHWIRIFAKWTQEFGCPNAFQNIKIFHWDIAFIKQDAYLLSIYFDKSIHSCICTSQECTNITSILQSFLCPFAVNPPLLQVNCDLILNLHQLILTVLRLYINGIS